MFALGALYGGGHDIAVDRALAARWFRAAAELGHPIASLMLGRYLRKGLGVEADPVEAARWFNQALKLGVEAAAEDLAAMAPPALSPPEPDAVHPFRAAGD
jgi:TPR repeat protein